MTFVAAVIGAVAALYVAPLLTTDPGRAVGYGITAGLVAGAVAWAVA